MDENDREDFGTLTNEQWKLLVKQIDKQTNSPDQRSDRILKLIREHYPEVSLYDLWCFAVYILQSLMVEVPAIREQLKFITRTIYILHYRLQKWKEL